MAGKTLTEVAREAAEAAAVAQAAANEAAAQVATEERLAAEATELRERQTRRDTRYGIQPMIEPTWACTECGVAVWDRDVHDRVHEPTDWREIQNPVSRRAARLSEMRRRG